MKGDYSRNTFDAANHFSSVLMQQGRVLLDADHNEQTAILLHYIRTLAADIIGRHGGPEHTLGFELTPIFSDSNNKLLAMMIGRGRYWIDGILCENERPIKWASETKALADIPVPFLLYLDVWERHVTSVEEPGIREVALGGIDTSARVKVEWQIRWMALGSTPPVDLNCVRFEATAVWQGIITKPNRGKLSARAQIAETPSTTPCIVSPEARYRGLENQLYRVEIHRGGAVDTATFKWSRENGSVVFPIESVANQLVTVESLGRDDRFGLEVGDWVEVVDDDTALAQPSSPEQLYKVDDIDVADLIVTLNEDPHAGRNPAKQPFLRRWDHEADENAFGAVKLVEGTWIALEDGVEVFFEPGGKYTGGDYWQIPARTATADVEWPLNGADPKPLPPYIIEHHFAPLGIVTTDVLTSPPREIIDLRHTIEPVAVCCPTVTIVRDPLVNAPFYKFDAVLDRNVSGVSYRWSATPTASVRPPENAAWVVIESGLPFTVTVVVEGPRDCSATASMTITK